MNASRYLTVNQAADLLNVSAGYVNNLLDERALDAVQLFHDGPQMISREQLLAYRRADDTERENAYREMVHVSEEMGLYDA